MEVMVTIVKSYIRRIRAILIVRSHLVNRVLFFTCLAVFIFSMCKMGGAFYDYYKERTLYSDVRKGFYRSGGSEGQTVEHKKGSSALDSNLGRSSAIEGTFAYNHLDSAYEEYLKHSLEKSVDEAADRKIRFETLKMINKDAAAWIQIPGTNIDYPVLQAKDNEYYLKHGLDKKYTRVGSIFLDYRSNIRKLMNNTIIYGHNMRDGSMFQDLTSYKKQNFYKNNSFIYIETPYESLKWEVFSIYVTDVKFDYLLTEFETPQVFKAYLNTIREKSLFKKKIKLTEKDKILTLSTCSYEFDNARTVVHAKLVK
jgi:sortase B